MSTQQTSQDNPLADFGPNEWIVDEMYQRYLADPTQRRPRLARLLRRLQAGDGHRAPIVPRPDEATAAATRPAHAPPSAGTDATAAAAPIAPAKPTGRRRPLRPTPAAASRAGRQPAAAKPAAPPRPPAKPARRRRGRRARSPPLRGVAARIVQNMDASLERADRHQRARRAGEAAGRQPHRDQQPPRPGPRRQGQLHPPDRLRDGPRAGRAPGDEQLVRRGRRQAGAGRSPEHVNLGIAIDLAKPDGTRNLVVPSIKSCEQMDFRQFWQAYEDVVRRARRNELTMEDYAGTTISLTNPGGIGTVHSHPAADARPGRDHRRRRDGVPGAVLRA